ncbi:ATP-binding protein [Nocardioides sp. SYSU D00038]|uniref:ATP-binding protein n=1 Tax=Nocardioides sp. SYSU D00038 TaxID=2812554 RepID=UPI00196834B2|nr:ATP-binding protein [Nocardioides sp. SYSU D00038]
MSDESGAERPGTPTAAPPRAALGHLARLGVDLAAAETLDGVARAALTHLTALPGVRRVGLALSEGGGRRLLFTAAERPDAAGPLAPGPGDELDWCHIDAYDDVPLTTVVRTGRPVLGSLTELDPRYAALVARQPAWTTDLAALPLPGTGSPLGGLVLFYDRPQRFRQPTPGARAQLRLLEAVVRRTGEAVARVRAQGAPEPRPASSPEPDGASDGLELPDDPRAAAQARRFVRGRLGEWGVVGDAVDVVELCVSELVTNAVVHAGTGSALGLAVDDGLLTVTVRDRGRVESQAPRPADEPDPLRVHGRGLRLVETLADRWGSERTGDGTRVWFVVDLGRPAAGALEAG